ncbi:MAG: endonuclease domain-containing protein [Nostoc sp.]
MTQNHKPKPKPLTSSSSRSSVALRGLGGGVPGYPWQTPHELWKKLKPLARQMRCEATPAEKLLWQKLRDKQLLGFKFRRQQTIDRFIVDFYCNEARLVVEVDGEIHAILLEYISPAIISSRCGKYRVFINSLLPTKQLSPKILNFEDDSEISDEVVSELNEIAEKITTEISWQKSDILMIDNTRILHGRRSFTDDQRDIYIRLCSPDFSF